MRFVLSVSSLFISAFFLSQNRSADDYAGLPEKLKEQRDVRIYRNDDASNVKKIFRIYMEDSACKAELITTFLATKKNEKERNETISLKCMPENFLNLEIRNIAYLPKEEYFRYKKMTKSIEFSEINKINQIVYKEFQVFDGKGYYVRYKNNDQHNSFYYSSPETYLKEYPEINELKDFVSILGYIRNEFKIDF